MAARQTPYFAFELAVRLLHDYPWHPPPGLTATVAWRAAAIAGLYAAVEKLVLRPALLFTAWYFPGLRGLLGDALGGRAGMEGTVAAACWVAAAMLAAAEAVVLLVCTFFVSVHVPVRPPVLRPALPLRRRLAVVCCGATAGEGAGERPLFIAAYLLQRLIEYTGASTVAFLVVSRWRTGARLAGPEVVTAAALYAWAVVAVWVARGLAVLLQAALPPPIRPTGEVD